MAQAEATKLELGRARIAGRIVHSRVISGEGGKSFRTVIRLPAANVYDTPATVEVRSGDRLGGNGDEVTGLVSIGGYSKSYKTRDGDPVNTAEVVLYWAGHA